MKLEWQNGPEYIRIDRSSAEIVVGSGYGHFDSAGVCPLAEFLQDYCDYRNQIKSKFDQETLMEVTNSVRELLAQSGCRCNEPLTNPAESQTLIEVKQPSIQLPIIESNSKCSKIFYHCSVCGRNWCNTIIKESNGVANSNFEVIKGCYKGCHF